MIKKEEDAPRIMIAAHMDDAGFLALTNVTQTECSVSPSGDGTHMCVSEAQRFTLLTR